MMVCNIAAGMHINKGCLVGIVSRVWHASASTKLPCVIQVTLVKATFPLARKTIGTQDKQLRNAISAVPAGAYLFMSVNGMHLAQPSARQEKVVNQVHKQPV